MPFCIYCGGANEDGYRVCVHCGRSVTSAVVVQPPASSSINRPYPTTATVQPFATSESELSDFNFVTWVVKNKVWLFLLLVVAILGLVVYQFFLKKDPVKQAQTLAMKECACAQRRVQDQLRLKRSFLVNFKKYGFANGNTAQQHYDSLQAALTATADSCAGAIRDSYNELAAGYKTPKQFELFEERYAKVMASCKVQSDNGITELDQKAQQMILGLK